MIGFAIGYANDHFVVPLDVAVGLIGRIDSLSVTDTVGRSVDVPHISVADAGRPRTFRLFEPSAVGARTGLFLLPPTLVQYVESAPLEEVRFLHDEGANLAWAVETVTDEPGGFPTAPAATRSGSAGDGGPPSRLRYRLRTALPRNWFPLTPRQRSPRGEPPPAGAADESRRRHRTAARAPAGRTRRSSGARGGDRACGDPRRPRVAVQALTRRAGAHVDREATRTDRPDRKQRFAV